MTTRPQRAYRDHLDSYALATKWNIAAVITPNCQFATDYAFFPFVQIDYSQHPRAVCASCYLLSDLQVYRIARLDQPHEISVHHFIIT